MLNKPRDAISRERGDWGATLLSGGYNWDNRYETSGNTFFGSFYYGAILKFEPKNIVGAILKPFLELSYFPYFARLLDRDVPNYENLIQKSGMLSIAVSFSIEKKIEARHHLQ